MKVRIKSGDCPLYLTLGKDYDVVKVLSSMDGGLVNIKDDTDSLRYINISESSHLNGGSWEIVEE